MQPAAEPNNPDRPTAGPPPRRRRWLRGIAKGLYVFLATIATIIGFGTSPSDCTRMKAYADAVQDWQTNPDYRLVAFENTRLSIPAMQARVCFFTVSQAIMFIRSLPGMPPHLAVNPTSARHYNRFTSGPLSAYLQLTGEQDLRVWTGVLMDKKADRLLTDAGGADFLQGFKYTHPVSFDAGAVQGLHRLVRDVRVSIDNGFKYRGQLEDQLTGYIKQIADELKVPADVEKMTPDQQARILDRLDERIRNTDSELWRSKQVNDFLCGIWSGVFGIDYYNAITQWLTIRAIGQYAAVALWSLAAASVVYRRLQAVPVSH